MNVGVDYQFVQYKIREQDPTNVMQFGLLQEQLGNQGRQLAKNSVSDQILFCFKSAQELSFENQVRIWTI